MRLEVKKIYRREKVELNCYNPKSESYLREQETTKKKDKSIQWIYLERIKNSQQKEIGCFFCVRVEVAGEGATQIIIFFQENPYYYKTLCIMYIASEIT